MKNNKLSTFKEKLQNKEDFNDKQLLSIEGMMLAKNYIDTANINWIIPTNNPYTVIRNEYHNRFNNNFSQITFEKIPRETSNEIKFFETFQDNTIKSFGLITEDKFYHVIAKENKIVRIIATFKENTIDYQVEYYNVPEIYAISYLPPFMLYPNSYKLPHYIKRSSLFSIISKKEIYQVAEILNRIYKYTEKELNINLYQVQTNKESILIKKKLKIIPIIEVEY